MAKLSHIAVGILLTNVLLQVHAQTPKWWWEVQTNPALSNEAITLSSKSATAGASGTNVKLNQTLIAQPPILLKSSGTAQGYSISAAAPPQRDVQVGITDNKSSIARSSANTYVITIQNIGSSAATTKLTLAYGAAPGSSATPTPTFSSPICSSVPAYSSCSVTSGTTANVVVAAGSTVQLQWTATTMGTTVSQMQAFAIVDHTDGGSDVSPADNRADDLTSIF